jgi:hypothetical protein
MHEHSHKFSNGFSVKRSSRILHRFIIPISDLENVVLVGRMETQRRKRPLLDGAANAFLATLGENSELRCSTNSTTPSNGHAGPTFQAGSFPVHFASDQRMISANCNSSGIRSMIDSIRVRQSGLV